MLAPEPARIARVGFLNHISVTTTPSLAVISKAAAADN
jgi:hypothetical protein